MDIIKQIATELQIGTGQVKQTMNLLDEGNTIPFIARYRKEATGELDEVVIRKLSDRLDYLRNITARKDEVRRLIESQEKLTPEISATIDQAVTMQELEDIYRPFRPKRRTRASIAKEKGLEPLANAIIAQGTEDPEKLCAQFISEEVPTIEDALQGALDILAEQFGDEPKVRQKLRYFTFQNGTLVSEAVETESDNAKDFQMYFEYSEAVKKLPPHRILAINRGERLKVLRVKLQVDSDQMEQILAKEFITNSESPATPLIRQAIADSYHRLIAPSIEREIRNSLTEKAEDHGITIFGKNLGNLIMQAPVRGKNVLGVDPAYRTGCKVVAVNMYGDLLEHTTIYPHEPQNRWKDALALLSSWVEKYRIELVTIGNGTASRETEKLVAELISTKHPKIQYLVINEAGASVYSASDIAREEFPDLDVSIRGAVSIARRVQDPLAEFVKIDPKSIGVGLYQHDVNQKSLAKTLGEVVESCVNFVGVELNSASAPLLRYVSGLSANTAKEIINHRLTNGHFSKRSELKKVKGLGPKSFEQAAGFLRIAEADDPLDNTAVHPESYKLAREILKAIGYTSADLRSKEKLIAIKEKLKGLSAAQIATQLGAGEPTVRDILDALGQPGRDPRDELPPPLFRGDVLTIEDIKTGMELKGTVQNVVDFGAFVDIGVKKAGLIHISQMSDSYIKHPTDVLQVGDIVDVEVISIDVKLGRIGLKLKKS